MAASDVDYNNLPADAKARGEFQFLQKALAKTPHGIHQGIFVVTPSGKYLTKANVGWPSYDAKMALKNLREAVAQYRSMPKRERLANTPLTISDRSMPTSRQVSPPQEWLKIRSTTRSYSFEDMDLFDQRHPVYYKLDRLWLTPASARELLPANLAVGQQTKIGKTALRHLTYDSHLMLGCSPWPEDTAKKAEVSAKIVAKKGDFYQVRYVGTFHLDSHSQYNNASYRGDLLGTAVWDNRKKQFTRFKWVTLGKHNKRVLRTNETKGQVHITTAGAVFELDPIHQNDRGIPPHRWHDAYPKFMLRQLESDTR